MFETLFFDVLNSEHELLRAARLIDWDGLDDVLGTYYSPLGREGKSIRLMVGIHILKHRYDCSDERAVGMLHENAYWQCFCGFNSFQGGQILEASSLVKFRNRIGKEGMKQIEAVLFEAWADMGLVKTRRVAVDTTAQSKNIAYPTDADLLYRIREKIVKQVKRVREEVALRKPFRTYVRTGKKLLLGIKKFPRKNPERGDQRTQRDDPPCGRASRRGSKQSLQSRLQGEWAETQPSGLYWKENCRTNGTGALRRNSQE